MKLTDKNKKIVLLGAAGVAAAYLLTAGSSGDGAGFGGGGGFGGVGASEPFTESASESEGSTTVNYTLPTPVEGFSFAAPFGDGAVLGGAESVAPLAKKTTVSELDAPYGPEDSTESILGRFNTSVEEIAKDVEQYRRRKLLDDAQEFPMATDGHEAASLLFMGGKKASMGDGKDVYVSGSAMSARVEQNKRLTDRLFAAANVGRTQSRGSSGSGGYSTVRISADNPRGRSGWQEVGAKKPTAPGQPDRY